MPILEIDVEDWFIIIGKSIYKDGPNHRMKSLCSFLHFENSLAVSGGDIGARLGRP